MEGSQAVAPSYSSLVDSSIFGNGEESHADGSSEEAWFDDDCENDHELHNEWKLRRDKFYNDGYREGTIEGQKDAAQDGFNLGFKDSVMVGYKWGIVRGVTSALAHLPDTLKEKLVEKDEVRREFMDLHGNVNSISTEDALKLYHENIERKKSAEASGSDNSDTSLTHQTHCTGLEIHVRKLELLLEESCAINVPRESIEKAHSSISAVEQRKKQHVPVESIENAANSSS